MKDPSFRIIRPEPTLIPGFDLVNLGVNSPFNKIRHQSPEPENWFFLLLKDQAEVGCGNVTQTYPPNTFLFIPFEQGAHYGANRTWNRSFLRIRGPAAGQFLKRHFLNTFEVLPGNCAKHFEQRLIMIHAELTNPLPYDPSIILNDLECLFKDIARERKVDHLFSRIARKLLPAREYLKEHFKDPIPLDQLAKKAGYTPQHFSVAFKRVFGESPRDFLISVRLAESVELLRDDEITLEEISHQCGYDDVYYFSRLFKKRFRISPGRFRKKNS